MEHLYRRIASTLKALRQKKGWSLDKAALETGVSKAMLGQIEREESSPTIATLWKIASGFETSFSSFIDNLQSNFDQSIYRAGETQNIHPDDSKIRVLPLFPFDSHLNFEVFIIELLPGCEHLSPPHANGVIEHVIVTEGYIEVFVDNHWRTVAYGEGLRFLANQPHGYRNASKEIARIHDMIHYPAQENFSTTLIYELETSLLTPEVRCSASKLQQVIADEFIEIGSSGNIYHKSDLLEVPPIKITEPYKIRDFSTTLLSTNVVLATYSIRLGLKSSLRSSIWRYQDNQWQMIFHQGTLCHL